MLYEGFGYLSLILQKLNIFLKKDNRYMIAKEHLVPPTLDIGSSSVVEKACLCVPLIMVGSSWGSGVIISPLPDCCTYPK
jgi:hypothetical protein